MKPTPIFVVHSWPKVICGFIGIIILIFVDWRIAVGVALTQIDFKK